MKKIISVVLVLTLVLSVVCIPSVSAAEIEEMSGDSSTSNAMMTNTDLSVGGSSLGEMLGSEFEEAEEELAEDSNNVNMIYEIIVQDGIAYVNYHSQNPARMIVGIYDESGQTMYGSAMQDVESENSVAQLSLDNIDPMPQYYIVKAYLLDKDSNIPLCKQFECNTYTKTMQEFLEKTTSDFEDDKVLNLDNDDDSNFLVYNEDTVLVETGENTNNISNVDNENNVYIIENIDDSIASLQPGEVFAYDYNSEDTLIIKVESIVIDGTTATITGAETSLTEVFDYIKIEAENNTNAADVDNSNLEEGVEYLETSDKVDSEPVGVELVNFEESMGMSLKYELKKEFGAQGEDNKLSLKGTIGCSFNIKLKAYYDAHLFDKDDVEVSIALTYQYDISVSLNLKDKVAVPLGNLDFMIAPGVYVGFTPSIIFEANASISVSGKLTGQVGKKFKNGKFDDNSKKPEFTAELKFEGKLFIGFSLEPHIKIIGDVIKASMTVKAGLTIKGSMTYSASSSPDDHPKSIHECTACIDGELSFNVEISFELSVVKKWKWSADAFKASWKLGYFYYNDELGFGFGKCPNLAYKQTITVLDSTGKPVSGADVNGTTTNAEGIAYLYLKIGRHTLNISKSNTSITKIIFVEKDKERKYTLNVNTTSNYSNNTGGSSGTVVNQNGILVSGKVNPNDGANSDVSYTLYNNGLLSISGSGVIYGMFTLRYLDAYRDKIKTVNINNGIRGLDSMVFAECHNLTTVNIPASINMEMLDPFMDCPSLLNINVDPNCSVVTSIDGVLYSKDMKTLIAVPPAKSGTFTIPNTVETVETLALGLNENSQLTTVNIPASVKRFGWDNSVEISGPNLKNFNVSENNSVFASINGVLFNKSKTILLAYPKGRTGTYKVPNGVTTIKGLSFMRCHGVTSVEISNSVSCIEGSAFRDCNTLSKIYIPKSVTSLNEFAFYECKSFKDIYYEGTSAEWSKIIVDQPYSTTYEITNATKHFNATIADFNSGGYSPKSSNISAVGAKQETETENIGNTDFDENNVLQYTRENLVPDTEAILMIVRGTEGNYSISSDSILYISQATADKYGNVHFNAYGGFPENECVALIFGECNHPHGVWKTERRATHDEPGLENFVCDICGGVAESREITFEAQLGDTNLDGYITIRDVTAIQRHFAELSIFNDEQIALADTNGDGEININDATHLQKYLAEFDGIVLGKS